MISRVTSQYRGVRWHYPTSKWEARIFDGSRQISLGSSHSEEEAAKLYDQEARRLRGNAAVVNFPQNCQREDNFSFKARLSVQDQVEEMRAGQPVQYLHQELIIIVFAFGEIRASAVQKQTCQS